MTLPMTWSDLGKMFDGPHATPKRQTTGPYFLNISSLKGGRLDLAASDHISLEQFAAWTRRVTPREGDLLFSYETRLGEAALMPPGIDACLGRRMALLRPDPEVVDSRYLLYYFLSPSFQKTLTKHTIHGATVPRILLSEMPTWPVDVHDVGEQRGIAEMLGALDDKIAANATLTATAEGLMIALASLAPAVVEVNAIASHSTSSVRPEFFDVKVAHFSLPAFDVGVRPETAVGLSIKSNKFAVTKPSVLMSKLNPRIPRIWNVPMLPAEIALASTEFVVLQPTEIDTSELWSALSHPDVSADLTGKVAGTSGSHQRVKPGEILGLRIRDPRTLPDRVRGSITRLGLIAHQRRAESAQLANARDALLPQLMSGNIKVKDAERVVEGVV